MQELCRKCILPVAAVVAALNCHCHAQIYSGNAIGHIQAIDIVSQLKKGMQQQDVEQLLVTNRLLNCQGGCGDNFSWTQVYSLTDNCVLVLGYAGDDWGRKGTRSNLEGACIIESNRNVISIPLANFRTNAVVQTMGTNSVVTPAPVGP